MEYGIYEIENCGNGCHVLVRINEEKISNEEPPPMIDEGSESLREEDLHPQASFSMLSEYTER